MAVPIPPRVRTVARVVIALAVAVAAVAAPTPAVAGVIDLSPTSNVASSPDVVVDQAGNTTAIWVERDPSDAFSAWIAAAYKPAGQPWEERKVLTETANRRVATPRLAVDPAGRVTAVWGWALGDTSGFVQSASRAAGPNQPWTSPVGNLSSDDPMEQPAERGLQLVADAQGNMLAAWFQRNTTSTSQFDVMVAERPPGGPWSTATPVAVQATGSPGPEALVAARGVNGHAVIGWSRPVDATTTEVKVVFRAPGDAWSTPHTITLTGTSMLTPLVEGLTAAVDGAGRATLCWEGSLQGIACSDRSAGAWSGSYPVADNASTTPNIAAGPADTMLLAWRGPTDSGGQIRPVVAKTRQGGGAWGP